MHVQDSSREEGVEKIQNLIREIKIAMFTTTTAEGELRSRPMAVQEMAFDGNLWFFSKDYDGKVEEIAHHPQVNVTFSRSNHRDYVSLSGTATVTKDRARMQSLWSPAHRQWFPDGLLDPHLTLIRVQTEKAEYWDSPSSAVVYMYYLAKQVFTGRPLLPSLKEHARITLNQR